MNDREEEQFMLHLDDNVFDPITRKGQEAVYDQFYDLMLSLNENFSKEFSPYYSIASFFERIGKGNLWDEVNIYEGIETDKLDYYNGESLANDIDRISVKIVENFQKGSFFSKNNITQLYKDACEQNVGNSKAIELLDSTFYRFGRTICSAPSNHLDLFGPYLLWDRLVALPLLWKHPHDIAEKTAKSRWEKAEKFYDTLLATYHNKNFINLELPFIRLLLQRRFINHICDIKQRKFSIKGSSFIKKIWISYKIKRLEAWVKNFLWAFKYNSDLGDVQLMHFAIYGFSDSNGDDHSRKPGVCITCDPIEVVEKRLFLCRASHNELAQQVHGWNFSLCPGKIICLKFTNQKFVHVKTIDVQQFFDSFESRRRSRFNFNYKVSMFFSAIADIIKNKKNNLLSKIFR